VTALARPGIYESQSRLRPSQSRGFQAKPGRHITSDGRWPIEPERPEFRVYKARSISLGNKQISVQSDQRMKMLKYCQLQIRPRLHGDGQLSHPRPRDLNAVCTRARRIPLRSRSPFDHSAAQRWPVEPSHSRDSSSSSEARRIPPRNRSLQIWR
jgi:hypothetical protein